MTTATLNFSAVQKNLKLKINSADIPAVNWKFVCFTGFFISLTLLVFYVWQINDLIRGSYLTNSYAKQISLLSEENKNLQVSFAENSFLGQALEKIQALNFQKITPGSVKYINVPDNLPQVAQADKNI